MRLMLLGTDRNIFTPGSAVRERIAAFGTAHTEALDSIVFSAHRHDVGGSQELAPAVHAHSTNSRSRLWYGWDAIRIAKTLPRPDLVSAQDPFETGLAALLIAQHFGVPLAVEVHTDFLAPAFARHSFLNRVRVWIARYVLARASGGYAVSEKVRDAIKTRYLEAPRLEVFPIFVDTSRFAALSRAPEKGSLLWVGRFTKEKDPLLALMAFAAARAAGHDVRLTMLGSGELEPILRRFVVEHNLEQVVSFPGWVDPADYLPTIELMLATSRYEGYGMATVEALASGVPVLSTDVGIAREAGAVIAEGGYVEALLTWLASPRERGVLKLKMYDNEADYFSRVAVYYQTLV